MIRLKIEGMTCKHCVMQVTKTLALVPGVEGPIEVSLEKGEATFEGQPHIPSVLSSLESADFPAKVL